MVGEVDCVYYVDIVAQALEREDGGFATDVPKGDMRLDAEDAC